MATLKREVRVCNKTGQVRGVKEVCITVSVMEETGGVLPPDRVLGIVLDLSPKGLTALRQGIINGLKPNGQAVATLGAEATVVPMIDKITTEPEPTLLDEPQPGLDTPERTAPGVLQGTPSGPLD